MQMSQLQLDLAHKAGHRRVQPEPHMQFRENMRERVRLGPVLQRSIPFLKVFFGLVEKCFALFDDSPSPDGRSRCLFLHSTGLPIPCR